MGITAIDYYILSHFILPFRCAPLTALMTAITHLGDGGMVWLAIALICLLRPKTRRAGIAVLAALVLGLLIGNMTIKPLIARPRPFITFPELTALVKQGGYSFPSAHAMSSFAAATAIFFFHRKSGAVCLVLAALIAFSRLYVCVHYPSDVLCGILLGIGIGFVSGAIVRYTVDKIHYAKLRR